MKKEGAGEEPHFIVYWRCGLMGEDAGYLEYEVEGVWQRTPRICFDCMDKVIEMRRPTGPDDTRVTGIDEEKGG